jgi:hypothetical protein
VLEYCCDWHCPSSDRDFMVVSDVKAEVARLRAAGVKFRHQDIVTGPGGRRFGR